MNMHALTNTFPGAFLLSMMVHITLFGSALAIAHYRESIPAGRQEAILVSLVDGSPGPGDGQRTAGAVRATVHALQARSAAPAFPLPDPAGEPAAVTAEKPSGGSDNGEAQFPAEAAGSAGKGSGPAGESAGVGEGGLSTDQWQYLRTSLERAKTYPRMAREKGIEGKVLVRFKVLPSGAVESVDIVQSSGAAVLDEASIRTVYRAAPMPFVSGWIEVPMVYELK